MMVNVFVGELPFIIPLKRDPIFIIVFLLLGLVIGVPKPGSLTFRIVFGINLKIPEGDRIIIAITVLRYLKAGNQ